MRVSEIFYSLQGEGINTGVPTTFIRLAGCNLRPPCSWCDTKYAQPLEGNSTTMTVEEIEAEVHRLHPYTGSWVCITGGEPLLQTQELEKLVSLLKRYLYKVECFTNGTLPRPFWWTRVDSWVIDFKPPSAKVTEVPHPDWDVLRITDQVKIVVGSKEDLDFASSVIRKYAVSGESGKPEIFISPCIIYFEGMSWTNQMEWFQTVANFCADKKVRMMIQLQKLVWGNQKGR